ncbi:competence type IV pilus major pilin ComGC [Cytobacillus firmus]|uniref:competence type IV pilus major pilin ComGC n=1 Tax=Cytobacillus firmus TaxID=1399 RepID=UPI00077C1591|nr:competence type IV pilus major pilin ComGC [Cytobacillus firmus]MBG9543040.1 competence protein ComG [Cytobacillus firmus]MBG9552300.1 competence protein ComG [Cytobacillus firmus]MBG9557410.1 competence protein ComG [Cytobacillus firmus]MBG9575661.1 competence protein ComG [Cytobacillus firmus]MBG9590370.1 competence protein ComG [Cytobacillus firmus]
MKWRMLNNNRGFTLIEMMIVLLVISVLLIITIPNVTKHNSKINSKGCDAFVKMVQAQVQAYEIDKKALPSNIQDLVDDDYLNENNTTCPNGNAITISADGKVESEES